MTPANVATLCVLIVIGGCIQRLTQLVLWILNGHRS